MEAPDRPTGEAPPKKGLGPVQVGGGLGAAAVVLFLLASQDARRRPDGAPPAPGFTPFQMGLLAGGGGIAGAALGGLYGFLRGRKRDDNPTDEPGRRA